MKKEKIIPVETQKQEVSQTSLVKEPSETQKSSKQTKITKVGEMLREVRLQKGLKLLDVAKQLCIRKHYLESIEESSYDDIPAFPYGIGFVRSYAKFLGLNSENIVELYKEETHISEPVDMHVLEPQQEASVPDFQYLIISVIAILLLSAGWLMFNRMDHPEETTETKYSDTVDNGGVIVVEEFNAEQAPSNEDYSSTRNLSQEGEPQVVVTEEPYQESSTIQNEPQTTEERIEDVSSDVSQNPITVPNSGVFIEVLKEAWVEVKDENKLYLSKVLQPGEVYAVPEGSGMILSVGKEDGVRVYVNGVETPVVRPNKKMNIPLDQFLNTNH